MYKPCIPKNAHHKPNTQMHTQKCKKKQSKTKLIPIKFINTEICGSNAYPKPNIQKRKKKECVEAMHTEKCAPKTHMHTEKRKKTTLNHVNCYQTYRHRNVRKHCIPKNAFPTPKCIPKNKKSKAKPS